MISSFVLMMEAANQQLSCYNVDERYHFQDMLLSSMFEMEDDLHLQDHNLGSPSAGGLSDIAETLPYITDFLLDSTLELDTVSTLLESTGEDHGSQQETTQYDILPDLLMQSAPVEICVGTGHGAPPAAVEPTVQLTLSPTSILSRPETSSLDLAINVSSPVIESGEDNEEEGHGDTSRVNTPTTANAKNVVSERNRRKRVSQQMLSLRSLVPNITKMDKRSVLVDALAYLRSIHEEIAFLEEELNGEEIRNSVHASLQTGAPHQTGDIAPGSIPRPKGEIIKLETEKMEEKRFIMKMTWKGRAGLGGEVLHMIEAMDLEITYTVLEYIQSQVYEITVFIKAKKEDKMTEENLKKYITSTATRSGLLVLVLGQEDEIK